MAFREVTMLEVKEVLWRWLDGGSKKTIARHVGIARNTVRAYIEAAEAEGLAAGQGLAALSDEKLAAVLARLRSPGPRERGESWAVCEGRKSFIAAKLGEGLLLTKVHRLLGRAGVHVPYMTLYRFAVAELDFGRGTPGVPVADGEPGKELQVDTGWMTLLPADDTGRQRRFRAWIFTAVHSRHRFVYPCFHETTEGAIEACEAAWQYFGGVFEVIIPDNTKAIVQKADPLEPVFVLAFLEYAQARGFHIDATRVKHPKDKPRVERTVQTVREDCFRGEQLLNLEDTHRRGRQWCTNEYGMRRHSTTQRLPLEHFNEVEKPALKPVPSEPYDVPLWADPTVGPDQLAVVAKAFYSLPRRFRGKKLRARADSQTVRFYWKRELAATRVRQPPGGRDIRAEDYPEDRFACAQRDTAFLRKQAASHGKAVERFAEVLLDSPLPWTSMRRVYGLLGLCRRFGSERVNGACVRALEAEMHSVHRLERILRLAMPPEAIPAGHGKVLPLARYLRPATQYALPLTRRGDKNTNPEGDDE